MTFEYADVNGVRLHYARAGEGPLIVFLHGYPRHWYLWRHQLADLGRDHLAVALDLRGYNLSSKPERDLDYGVWLAVEDVRELVDRLGYERFVLVGHDWGGAIAWSFALHHPERLEALMVMSAAHPALLDRELRDNAEYRETARFMFALRGPDGPETFAANDFALLRQTLHFPFIGEADRAEYLEAWSRPGAMRSMLAIDRREGMGPATDDGTPARGNYVPEMLSLRVEVPTLAVYSDRDPYNHPGCFEGLDAYVPDLMLKRLDGVSHWIPEEVPDVVGASIRELAATRA
jgi:pimeloyl-ACP methyl ester carboxylesterase